MMKIRAMLAVAAVLSAGLAGARAQGTSVGDGTFVNFDFELADVPPRTNNFTAPVTVAKALPGWTAYLGTGQITSVVPNLSSLAAASISIITPQWSVGPVFQGNYMVLLQAAQFPSSLTPTTAAIAQTGQIPLAAQTLFFDAKTSGLQVTFNGTTIPYKVFAKAANFTVYEGDVSALAGQTGELRFTVQQVNGFGSAFLDNIEFVGVPEPRVSILFCLGGFWLFRANAKGRGPRADPFRVGRS